MKRFKRHFILRQVECAVTQAKGRNVYWAYRDHPRVQRPWKFFRFIGTIGSVNIRNWFGWEGRDRIWTLLGLVRCISVQGLVYSWTRLSPEKYCTVMTSIAAPRSPRMVVALWLAKLWWLIRKQRCSYSYFFWLEIKCRLQNRDFLSIHRVFISIIEC